MITGESVDFNEFHSWKLKKIIDLTDRIALFTSPYFSYRVKPGTAELELAPSDTKTLLDNPDLTGEENQAAQDIDKFYSFAARTAITQAITLGIIESAKGL